MGRGRIRQTAHVQLYAYKKYTVTDRTLREMQIGTKSMESEDGVVFAGCYTIRYECPNGHEFEAPLSTEVAPPASWKCRCGVKEELVGETPEDEEAKPAKPVHTHWDMLCERRSLEELEVVLNEQLMLFREGRLRSEDHYREG